MVIRLDEALTRVLARIPVLPAEGVELVEAWGRVLARDVLSDIDVSPFDNAEKDGYAVRAADTVGASPDRPVCLQVLECIAAGSVPKRPVDRGQASRITTGAPLPEGADAVVMVEDTGSLDSGRSVAIRMAVEPEQNVRRRGQEVRAGQVVLAAGEVLGAAALGLAAAVGHDRLDVHRRPQVGLVSTGDELVEVTCRPGPGQIRNSNSYALAAQVLQAGGRPHLLGVARDNARDTRALLSRAADYDVLISTGGVSMGDFDVVRTVLEELGDLDFWQVAMRPGAPQTFGTIQGTPFFGLPGNPTSTMVGFEVFVRPALRRMAGFRALERPRVTARLQADFTKPPGRCHLLRGRLEVSADGGYRVGLSGNQSSALLGAMHRAHCLVLIPEEVTTVPAGSPVTCIRLDVEEGTVLAAGR